MRKLIWESFTAGQREGACFPFCALLCSHTPPRSFRDPPEPLGQNPSLLKSLQALCDLPAPPLWLCLLSPSLWVYYMVVSPEGEHLHRKDPTVLQLLRELRAQACLNQIQLLLAVTLHFGCLASCLLHAMLTGPTSQSPHTITYHSSKSAYRTWAVSGSFPVAIRMLFWGTPRKAESCSPDFPSDPELTTTLSLVLACLHHRDLKTSPVWLPFINGKFQQDN